MPVTTQSNVPVINQQLFCKCSKGFTLVELIIVVAIIAVLAAISIPMYNNYVDKAQRAVAIGALDTFRINLESYNIDNQAYPQNIDFTTGKDPDGVTVLSLNFIIQINNDFSSIVSYVNIANSYTLIVKANDRARTTITLTLNDITY